MEKKLKQSIPFLLTGLFLTGCQQLASIPFTPTQTPESWLQMQPFIKLQIASKLIYLIQPSTTAIVYLLGVIAIGAGLYFLKIMNGQKSRLWWGVALLLWGLGALLAGTSYEAFSYAIKCAGRSACIWTSWWEIVYLVFSVASLNAMLVAEAYTCATGKLRRRLIGYALSSMAIYTLVVLIGTLLPLKFLISFELLILVCVPNLVIFLVLNGGRYAKHKKRMDLALLGTWAWLILTIGAYFLYYVSGLSQKLWAQGIWFTENDVLHIGLIIWMLYIVGMVSRQIVDLPELENGSSTAGKV
jgi:hypothetical protein